MSHNTSVEVSEFVADDDEMDDYYDVSHFGNTSVTRKQLPEWALPPWPEWKDSFINMESWEQNESTDVFEDPTGFILPNSIKPDEWIRPDLLPNPVQLLVDWSTPKFDLINSNISLCEMSDLIRIICAEISELYDFGFQNMFQSEGQGICFIPNSEREGVSWKPWDHIYSCCKAGVKDRPRLNPLGKYYIRLYYLGCWRRITVDDRVPVKNDKVCLPLTTNNELWPLLLVKGLLKIASLSWDYDTGAGVDKSRRFSTISALTGFVHEWTDIQDPLNGAALWEELTSILPRFEGQPEIVENYWTTGKTKKQRFAEAKMKQESQDKGYVYPEDLSTRWWAYLGLAEKLPDVEYLDFSDNEEIAAVTPGKQIPTISVMSMSHFSFGNATGLDAAETEETEIELGEHDAERKQDGGLFPPKKGKKDKKRNGKKDKLKKYSFISADEVSENYYATEDEDLVDDFTKKKGAGKSEKGRKTRADKQKKDLRRISDTRSIRSSDEKQLTIATEEFADLPDGESLKKERSSSRASTINAKMGVKTKLRREKQKKHRSGSDRSDQSLKKIRSRSSQDVSRQNIEVDDEVDEDTMDGVSAKRFSFADENYQRERSKKKSGIPSINDILCGVLKYLGAETVPWISAYESTCGKNIPDTITVILSVYPKPEENGVLIPSFLHHPMNLVETRDVALPRDPNHLSLPLWKTFRWKAWAMKKGLIPLEVGPEDIRCVKVKTPFALKNDWYHTRLHTQSHDVVNKEEEDEEKLPLPISNEICRGTVEEEINESPRNLSARKSSLKKGSRTGSGVLRHFPSAPGLSGDQKVLRSFDSHISDSALVRKRQSVTSKSGRSSDRRSKKQNKEVEPEETEFQEEAWLGEAEETLQNIAPMPTPVDPNFVNAPVASACGVLWFHVDLLAPYIRKLCKFYSTRPMFGSCYVLQRKNNWDGDFEFFSPLPSAINDPPNPIEESSLISHKEITDCNALPNSYNLTIQMESYKILDIKNHHISKSLGIGSAFYLFSDSSIDQEILVSIDVLQLADLDGFIQKHRDSVDMNLRTRIGLVVECWDWLEDYYDDVNRIQEPLLQCSTEINFSTHLNLKPGRNTLRIWVAEFPGDAVEPLDSVTEVEDSGEDRFNSNPFRISPYIVKFASKTPIQIGSRDEIINCMTNEPVLLLKRCDSLAQCFWAMFLLFGKPLHVYKRNLESLRKCYCPLPSSKKSMSVTFKKLKDVHNTFEEDFVELIKSLNDGKLTPMMLLGLRCLLLNPMLGKPHIAIATIQQQQQKVVTMGEKVRLQKTMISVPLNTSDGDENTMEMEMNSLEEHLEKQRKTNLKTLAANTIQRYFRGWSTRRIFQMIIPTHPMFPKVEYAVRKIAYILACNTDSVFSQDPASKTLDGSRENYRVISGEQDEGLNTLDLEYPPSEAPMSVTPSVTPNPPKWSVKLLKGLITKHPVILNRYSHAYCLPLHVKVRETIGSMPSFDSQCMPFFRRIICILGENMWCTCMIQLDVIPELSVVMKIIDNDTKEFIESQTPSSKMFLGRLDHNKLGYTILCFRSSDLDRLRTEFLMHEDMPPVFQWKIRVVTPTLNDHLVFKDELHPIRNSNHSNRLPKQNSSNSSKSIITTFNQTLRNTIEPQSPVSTVSPESTLTAAEESNQFPSKS